MRIHRVVSLFALSAAVACGNSDQTAGNGALSGPEGTDPAVSGTGPGAPSAGPGGTEPVGPGGTTPVPPGGGGTGAGPIVTPTGPDTTTPGNPGGGTGPVGPSGGGAGPVPPAGGGTPPVPPVGNGGSIVGPGGAGPTPGPMDPAFVYPAQVAPWQPSQACVDRAAQILSGLSLRQKAGQMVQGNTDSLAPGDVASYQLGSAFSGGSADPASGDSPQAWRSHVESYEAQAAGFGIPLIYGVDAVHGHNNVSDAVIFPHNIGLGATRNPALAKEVGRITAREMRGTSTDWTFGPAISPARDERWGRTFESYSEDPGLTAEMGMAVVQGLQGDSLSGGESVLACAKHFAGDGATQGGVDQGNAELDEATFRTLGVEVYQPLINAGVGNIMVSYSSYNGSKMTGQRQWLTDVLKGEMGFSGFLGSDWAATGQLPGAIDVQVATAVNAGIDMLMEPYLWAETVDTIERAPAAAGSANIPESRIDDAVMRILSVKCELGMLEPGYNPSGDAALLSEVGSQAHRDVARQAVRESAVLLENAGALPIPATAVVHVAGSGGDSLVRQCGGWTVDWQGLGITSSNREPGVTSGTTILAGIRAIAGDGNVTFSENGSGVPNGATHIIVVLSEAPYAEGQGDTTDLDLAARTPDVPVLEAVSSAGVPVIAVLLSGRPLIIEPYLDLADAWVAAWLPGSEANALADVLFGVHPPTGKLGHSWPRSMAQIPINVGDADYESDPPLYPFGHGLSY